ncbi:MAG: 16S rRNA (cytosine(1402)-N(4))-methyltransferase RsmH [Planctomycetes bacterium]|nr:16S rRNA (cytosine(1402)-N(4))-methyltransferase RsmH [Planctomycetota bacterium]
MTTIHVSVLPDEILYWLAPRPGGIFVDGTLGGGGHARLLAQRVGEQGRVLGLDRDPAAVAAARIEMADGPIEPVHGNYADLGDVLDERGISAVDGILLDLGLSSDQLADSDRGFSFEANGPLDLRFDPSQGEPASQWLARLDERSLADLIYQFGDERFSRRIARKIVEQRRRRPIRTSGELAELIRSCVPRSRGHRIDPATRTFQALRIAVNDELRSLEKALRDLPGRLRIGGRFAIISFHSLEDRMVKNAFRSDRRLENLTRKPIRPTEAEIARNPRSRSAKLRVAELLADPKPEDRMVHADRNYVP